MKEYYTYAYLREDKTPYYIGKGIRNRAHSRHQKGIKLPKDKSRIIFLKQNLTEEEAFQHEKYMIAVFGRKDLGTGILHNKTNGGEGNSGLIHSNESKLKMATSKNTKYWNNGIKTIRRIECPGEEWKRGIGTLINRKGVGKKYNESGFSTKGLYWWNDGFKNTMKKECPGEGWMRGKIKNKT